MNKELVKKHFAFLEKEFGMVCATQQKMSGGFQAVFANLTTVVQLDYEIREHYLFITLFKKNEEGFDLDDVASLSGAAIVSPDGQTVEETMDAQAKKLRTYGAPIMQGDFRQFPELRRIVEARAAAFARH